MNRPVPIDLIAFCFERQPIKVAPDRDKALISPVTHDTTSAALTTIPAPRQPEERYAPCAD